MYVYIYGYNKNAGIRLLSVELVLYKKVLNSQIQNADEINILLLSAHCLYE